jgi:hypothetical protein
MPVKPRRRPWRTQSRTAIEAGEGTTRRSVGAIFCAGATTPQTEGAETGVTNGADRERGEEVYAVVVEPDPRLERLRRLDEWLSNLTVWQQHLLCVPFALVIAGIAIWLNSVLPAADPNLPFPERPFGPLP